uniref:uncharacterized protein LOC105349567 n=1 Tax=Fragaria vesca subsp. vesca TaxID=101020 RepID=UPI0005C9CCA9|nr:PREDICTED: uncharacterized protein LOC105349567 [Fragaria vesca subsp. vesca]
MDRERSTGLRLQIHALYWSSGEHCSPSIDTSSPLRSAATFLSPSPSLTWSFFVIAVQVFDRLLLFKREREKMSVLIVTISGDIVVDLYTNRCPLTAKNFLKLCKKVLQWVSLSHGP